MPEDIIKKTVRATIIGGNGGYLTVLIDEKKVKISLKPDGLKVEAFRKAEDTTPYRAYSLEEVFDAAVGQKMMF